MPTAVEAGRFPDAPRMTSHTSRPMRPNSFRMASVKSWPSSRFGTAGRVVNVAPRDGTTSWRAFVCTRRSSSGCSSTMPVAARMHSPACRSSVATTMTLAPSSPHSRS
jgi:hypothetical protein